MTDAPESLAERPTIRSREALEGDALSEVLQAIRLRGYAVSLHHAHGTGRPDLETDVRAIHIVESGTCRLNTARDSDAVVLEEGDLALLPLGTPHALTGEPGTRWISGIFKVDDEVAAPLLKTLPPIIVVRSSDQISHWLTVSVPLLRMELTDPRPGGRVMVSRILDLLFIHSLRDWVTAGDPSPSLLTATLDPAIGRAVAGIHKDPARPWSVQQLARLANASRSGFAARFTRLVGVTPAAYVTQVRLDLAAGMLRDTNLTVGRISRDVGYASEAGFSRAFSRHFGAAPAKWRRGQGQHLEGDA